MTSPSKRAANRANAGASTGPSSAAGKARSAQNARQHGLSVPVVLDRLWSKEADWFADAIVDGCADPEIYKLAREVAIAQIDLCRIRSARQSLLMDCEEGVCTVLKKPTTWTSSRNKLDSLITLDRYERRALSRRRFLIRALHQADQARTR